jgi:hypothetical protein
MKGDVPNSTIAVLLVLTILVSVVGTWTVLEKTKQIQVRDGPVTGAAIEGTTGSSITGNVVIDTDDYSEEEYDEELIEGE